MGLVSLLFAAFLLSQRTYGESNYQYKSLAGPAAEFPSFEPPSLETSGMHSRYYVLPLLTLDKTSPEWTHTFPVDYCDIFALTVFSADPNTFELKFTLPSGATIEANTIVDEKIGYGTAGLHPCRTFLFDDPVPIVGQWTVTVSSSDPSKFPANASLIASFYPSDLILQAYVPAENLIAGRTIQIIALLPSVVKSEKNVNSTRNVAALDSAVTTVYLPDGTQKDVEMIEGPDDQPVLSSIKGDATDLYATFEAPVPGIYKNLVQLSGELSDGTKFIRSLWYVFTVAHPSITITGNVRAALHTHQISKRELIDFFIDVDWDRTDVSYRAFAQVWGKGENGEEVPVAWISGLVDVKKKKGCLFKCHHIQMQLDSKWLELVNAKPPLILKSVSLEELKAFITLSTADSLKVASDDTLMNWSPSHKAEDIEIDWEMKEGYNPYRVKKNNATAADGQILLLHGYCAKYNGFLLDYFENEIVFGEYGQNFLHDEYAKKVMDFVKEQGATRYSAVGHSQGGPVALHLYTYYPTGMDAVENGRVIQSIGSPYLGCPLAGILALIGKAFGILCGDNDDLTYDGAERWAAKIPMEKSAEVYYYTTQYPKDAPLLQRYCNVASQLVLAANNDGITEVMKGMLPNAHQVDNYEGECHIDGMNYPRQLGNVDRTKEINEKAAR